MSYWVSLDFETSSAANIRFGAAHYAAHPSTRLIMASYLPMSQGYPRLWWAGQPFPEELAWYVERGADIRAWNSFFEYQIWKNVSVPRHGWPEVPIGQFKDSIWRAVSANLPRALENAGRAVGAPVQKDKAGKALMLELTNQAKTPYEKLWTPEYRQRMIALGSYCNDDVLSEEGITRLTPDPPTVYPWADMPRIDAEINDRGVLCDLPLVRGMRRAAADETRIMNAKMKAITGGKVTEVSKIEAFKSWLLDWGVKLPTIREIAAKPAEDDVPEEDGDEAKMVDEVKETYRLRKNDVIDLLAGELPGDDSGGIVREALQMRSDAAKISAKKLDFMDVAAGSDGRLRGSFILHGAQQTGRWSGAGYQPHNFPRKVIPSKDEGQKLAEAYLGHKIEKSNAHHKQLVRYFADKALAEAIEAGRAGEVDFIREKYGAVLQFVSRMLRRTITARRGHVLLQGDYAQIEARITAWLAGQLDILNAFATGQDVYKIAAAPMVNKTIEDLSDDDRQLGKIGVLGLGFAGGAGVFVVMGMSYNIRMTRDQAKPIVYAWRDANKEIVKLWDYIWKAALAAINYPGRWFEVAPLGLIAYYFDGSCLYCRLPSGRFLRYWAPVIEGIDTYGEQILSVLSTKGRATFRRKTWRGLFIENCVQAIAADLLAGALEMMDRHNLPVVLHVHDSVAAEVEEERADDLLPLFTDLMRASRPWANGLPMGVDSHYGARFG